MRTILIICTLVGASLLSCCGMVDPVANQAGSFMTVFGGAGNEDGWSLQQTSDGGYILLGSTTSFGAGKNDLYLVKTDPSGVEEWSKTYGGLDDDEGRSVRQTADGGYIVLGSRKSATVAGTADTVAGGKDVWLIRTDAKGEIDWSKLFGGSRDETPGAVLALADGGYAIGASISTNQTGFNFWAIRTDDTGGVKWEKQLGISASEVCNDIIEMPGGGFLLAGEKDPGGVYSIISVGRVDAAGNIIRDTILLSDLVGFPNVTNAASSVVALNRGGYMLMGHTQTPLVGGVNGVGGTPIGPDSLSFMRLNDDATRRVTTWQNRGGRSFTSKGGSRGFSLVEARDGAVVGLGYARALDDADFYLVRITSEGLLEWERSFGGEGDDIGHALIQTGDGGYAMLGVTRSFVNGENGGDMMLVKVGSGGTLAP